MEDGISLIISTYERKSILEKIFISLINQSKGFEIEILVIDSYSKDGTREFVENFKKKYRIDFIKHHDINKNILSSKRNYGLKVSSYKKLILLDDDCIPDNDFIKNYDLDFKKIDEKTILSGVVDYLSDDLKFSPYLRFRKSKHFQVEDIKKNQILTKNFVAMNMCFLKSDNILEEIYFDENFIGYGFEDYEFAYRLRELGYKFFQSKARIYHNEGKPDLSMFLKKYYHLGRDGMKNFIKINEKAAKSTIYYKIEKNLLLRFFLNIVLRSFIFNPLYFVLMKLEKFNIKNLGLMINFFRLAFYYMGYKDRFIKSLDLKNKSWYD
jgi:GT2 family glycosyltransferase